MNLDILSKILIYYYNISIYLDVLSVCLVISFVRTKYMSTVDRKMISKHKISCHVILFIKYKFLLSVLGAPCHYEILIYCHIIYIDIYMYLVKIALQLGADFIFFKIF